MIERNLKKILNLFETELILDLQDLILSKIYYKNSQFILDDIISYNKYKNKYINLYESKGLINNNNFDDDMNLYAWLSNSLCSFFNDDIAYTKCIALNNIKKLRRFKSKNSIKLMGYFHDNFNAKSSVNRYLGCLTCDERTLFFNDHFKTSYI